MFTDKELAKVLASKEADRPAKIAAYQQGLAEGRYGPLYAKKREEAEAKRRAELSLVPPNVDPDTGEITEAP